MQVNKVFTRGAAVLVIRIAGAALQLVLVALAVALFPIEDVGQNALLWSTAVIARVGGTLGLDLYMLRELPSVRKVSTEQFGVKSRNLSWSLVKVIVPPVLLFLAVMFWLDSTGRVSSVMALSLPIVVLFSALQRLWSCQIRARGQLMLGQTLDAVILPTLAIFALVVCYFWMPDSLIVGQCLAIVLLTLLMFIILIPDWRQPEAIKSIGAKEWKQIVPLGVGSALSVAASRAPIIFVGMNSIAGAASYEIGQRIHSAATLASASATAVLFPRVKGLVVSRNTARLLQELVYSALLGLIPALLILGGLLIIGEGRSEAIMGSEYQGAWLIAVILTAAACLNSVTGLCHGVLAMAGSSRAFWVIAAVQAGITALYALIVFDGAALNMAIFVLVAEAARGVVLTILTWRLFEQLNLSPSSTKAIL